MPSSSLLKWLIAAFLLPQSWAQVQDPVRHYVEADIPSASLSLPSSRADAKLLRGNAPRVAVPPPSLRFGFEPWWVMSSNIFENQNISANLLQVPGKAQRELDKSLEASRKAQWAKAEAHLHAALKHYPQFSAAYYNLGVVALRKGALAEGEARIERALELDGHNLHAIFGLALLRLNDGDYSTSLRYAERFVALAPGEVCGLVMLGVIQTYNHRLDDALRTLNRVEAREHAKVASYHLLAGALHETRGDAAQAIAEYNKFLLEAPQAANAAQVRAAVAALQTTLARK